VGKDLKEEKLKYIFHTLLAILIIALIATIIEEPVSYYFSVVYKNLFDTNSIEKWGAFGDFIGGIFNPIFSIISILLILITLIQQQVSLKQTRQQIEQSFCEMTKSVAAQEKQAELSERQLKELLKKSLIDDSTKILNNLLNDLKNSIDENIICYKNPANKRTLKSQLLEIKSKNNSDQQESFLNQNEYSYRIFSELYGYVEAVLSELKNIDTGSTYNYYAKKLSVYEELLIERKSHV
jgi:uncharacterized membrane protein